MCWVTPGIAPLLFWCLRGRGQRSWSACSNHLWAPTGTKVLEVKEWYQNREDMLELKHINKITGLNVDYFKPGHPQALRGVWIPLLGKPRALGEGGFYL